MREIPVSGGKYTALVDDEDYPALSGHSWHINGGNRRQRFAVKRHARPDEGRPKSRYMHRDILNPPDGVWLDHINGNPLDNRRQNLRVTTPSLNIANTRAVLNRTSYRGVVLSRRLCPRTKRRWVAIICVHRKSRYLGAFATSEEAARAYDAAARKNFGDHARLNFPEAGEQRAEVYATRDWSPLPDVQTTSSEGA